ncbi:hypothetical protein BAE44_0005669, partial [Dichanthelium oligosanthes]
LRRPLELLMEGKTINHPDLTLSAVQLLLSRDDQVAAAEEKLVHALLQLHEKKPHEVRLRGRNLPPNLMKEVIKRFGADLEVFKKVCESAMKSQDGFPLCCLKNGCKQLLLADLRSLLPDKLDELFRASLNAFVASSPGLYRFCPTPDCMSIYQVAAADPDATLLEWRKGKENVKNCPSCGYTIEKAEGCNHVECRSVHLSY